MLWEVLFAVGKSGSPRRANLEVILNRMEKVVGCQPGSPFSGGRYAVEHHCYGTGKSMQIGNWSISSSLSILSSPPVTLSIPILACTGTCKPINALLEMWFDFCACGFLSTEVKGRLPCWYSSAFRGQKAIQMLCCYVHWCTHVEAEQGAPSPP